MNALYSRRAVAAGLGLFGLGLLAGCDTTGGLSFKHGKNLSDRRIGRTFQLRDAQGNVKMLSNYRGMMPMVFFGFTQCPLVCPTTLARAAKAKKLMGRDGDRLQVIFITVDPERDTPAIIDNYVKTFDPSFVALSGTLEETRATAKEYDVFFEKQPVGNTYTMSHTATSFVYDSAGILRLGLSPSLTAQECAEDLLTLMEIC